MNTPVLIAGILAAAATGGHFTVGSSRYLRPILDADLEEVPKRIVQCLFHYVSVWLVFSSCVMLWQGLGTSTGLCATALITFIAAHYAAFALVQLVIVAVSRIPGGVFVLFQWIFWVLIAVLALLGVCL